MRRRSISLLINVMFVLVLAAPATSAAQQMKPEKAVPADAATPACGTLSAISSVQTLKLSRVFGPKVVAMATSVASRPRATSTRPILGTLLRGSNVCQAPPR